MHISKFISFLLIVFLSLFTSCERDTITVEYGNDIPPAVPTGIKTVYAADSEILIAWNRNIEWNIDGYLIYRSINDTNSFMFHARTYNYYFYDDSLSYDSTYYYRVSANNRSGKESMPSEIVEGKPINKYPPGKVIDLSVNGRNWESEVYFYLTWTPRPESDIKGYLVYKGSLPGFETDANTYIGYTQDFSFKDTSPTQFYKQNYYKIKAIDKGGLVGDESNEVSDNVHETAEVVFPEDKSLVDYFNYFKIKTINTSSTYKIILQTNEYFGEKWSIDFFSSALNDTIPVLLTASYLQPYTNYYWRIITYSKGTNSPNSISKLHSFRIKL